MSLRSVCVFCGARSGARPEYQHAAQALGRTVAARGMTLVYGGGRVGLMGALADAALAGGGRVLGVIPAALSNKEVAHDGVSELRVVPSMHARKAMMAEESDAFIALPGGFGTLEELFEIVTWAQLGIHAKPIGVLNVAGFFDSMLALIEHSVKEGFIGFGGRNLIVSAVTVDELLDGLMQQHPAPAPPWVKPEET